jgi:hypothetical protein
MDKGKLYSNWVHSYEEDSENELVFRRPDYNFPLVRGGRDAIDLNPDNTFTQRGGLLQQSGNLAADDRYLYSAGEWNLEENDILSLSTSTGSPPAKLKIISITDDKLVFHKQA